MVPWRKRPRQEPVEEVANSICGNNYCIFNKIYKRCHTEVTIRQVTSSSILLSVVDLAHFQLWAKFQRSRFTDKGMNLGGGEKHPLRLTCSPKTPVNTITMFMFRSDVFQTERKL